jgi:hypothetical protein
VGGERKEAEWVVREGVGAGGEMTQALYAHMNNQKIKIKKKFCLLPLLIFFGGSKGVLKWVLKVAPWLTGALYSFKSSLLCLDSLYCYIFFTNGLFCNV